MTTNTLTNTTDTNTNTLTHGTVFSFVNHEGIVEYGEIYDYTAVDYDGNVFTFEEFEEMPSTPPEAKKESKLEAYRRHLDRMKGVYGPVDARIMMTRILRDRMGVKPTDIGNEFNYLPVYIVHRGIVFHPFTGMDGCGGAFFRTN